MLNHSFVVQIQLYPIAEVDERWVKSDFVSFSARYCFSCVPDKRTKFPCHFTEYKSSWVDYQQATNLKVLADIIHFPPEKRLSFDCVYIAHHRITLKFVFVWSVKNTCATSCCCYRSIEWQILNHVMSPDNIYCLLPDQPLIFQVACHNHSPLSIT